ncbi:hypothetical protein [Sphingomonas endolithica]|uniref:hypothetical protein n=1 Tax=Sphingomonas endolithica TaxID=2972485 RepID=UPI0021B0182A|nr:hypothetical protein [Sphingomonas sp. ZFBP2030]
MAADEARLGNAAPRTVSATQVARSLGYGYERTRALLEATDRIPTGSRRGVAFAIKPDAVRVIAARNASTMTVKAAAMEPLPHPVVDTMSPELGSKFCFAIGMALERRTLPFKSWKVSSEEEAVVRSAGWHASLCWPNGFENLLDSLLAERTSEAPIRGPRGGLYGGISAFLVQEKAPELDVYRDILLEHIRRNAPVSPKTKIFDQQVQNAEWISLENTSKIIGYGQDIIILVLTELGLTRRSCSPSDRYRAHMFCTADLKPVSDFLGRTESVQGLSAKLGCTFRTIYQFVATGILPEMVPGISERRKLVSKQSVTEMVDNLARLDEVHWQRRGALIDIRELRYMTRISEDRIFSAVVTGELLPRARKYGSDRFRDVLFDRNSVPQILADLCGRLTIAQATRQCGWKRNTISVAKIAGLLEYETGNRFLECETIEMLRARCIDLNELGAVARGLRRKDVRAALDSAGIKPMVPEGAAVSSLWSRPEALAVIQAHLAA